MATFLDRVKLSDTTNIITCILIIINYHTLSAVFYLL